MNNIFLITPLLFKKTEDIYPPNQFVYDNIKGYWKSRIDGQLLTHNSEFSNVASKKRDVETGEDQK